ncbi:MAG: phosphoribosyltransferase family protein [Candidatus Gottesmanbacteria bacterium]|nr:phosphoribosyltransferase family protein [Candidatus Gottesmanbacteria bacterium]
MTKDIVSILKSVGAVLTDDHFVYTSGKHGSVYINKDTLYTHPVETSGVGKMFAEKFKNSHIDVVVAPAIGGTILSQWTAYWLSRLTKSDVRSCYTEKDKGTSAGASESEQIFRRGYDKLVKGKRVLVLEDLTTTGLSVKKVVDVVGAHGGTVIAVAVMVNRDPKHVSSRFVGAPFFALGVLLADAYDEAACPLCKKGTAINTTVGHGKQFLAGRI